MRDSFSKNLRKQKAAQASGQEYLHVALYKYHHQLDFLRPFIENDGPTICSLSMVESIQQPSPQVTVEESEPLPRPISANRSQSAIVPLSRPAAAPGQSSQVPDGSSVAPEQSVTDPEQSVTDPGQSATDPEQSATEQPAYVPGQHAIQPLPKPKYDMDECLAKMSKTLDSFQKRFDDPTWNGLMGIHAAMQPLPASTRLKIIADMSHMVRGYYD